MRFHDSFFHTPISYQDASAPSFSASCDQAFQVIDFEFYRRFGHIFFLAPDEYSFVLGIPKKQKRKKKKST